MLQRTAILTLLLFLALMGGAFYHVVKQTESHSRLGQRDDFSPTSPCPTKQIRTDVQKDLWIFNEGFRLHHRMESPRSILTIYPKGDRCELVEEMQDMKCYLQENVQMEGRSMQQIRFIASASGTYYYSNQYFDAHQVFLALFRIPGNRLETELDFNEAFLKGVAQDVLLSFAEAPPHFQAKKFKAYVSPKQYE